MLAKCYQHLQEYEKAEKQIRIALKSYQKIKDRHLV
jgi:hypothetical protein